MKASDLKPGQFNINDHVEVRLTEHALKVHREKYEKLHAQFPASLGEYEPPEKDKHGWSRFQLWVLMADFGPSLHNGGKQLFVDNVIRFVNADVPQCWGDHIPDAGKMVEANPIASDASPFGGMRGRIAEASTVEPPKLQLRESWRFLEPGEIVRKGDEVRFENHGWADVRHSIGTVVTDSKDGLHYRRKIAEVPPPEQFVESGVCHCGLPVDEHNMLSGCNTPRDNPMPASIAVPPPEPEPSAPREVYYDRTPHEEEWINARGLSQHFALAVEMQDYEECYRVAQRIHSLIVHRMPEGFERYRDTGQRVKADSYPPEPEPFKAGDWVVCVDAVDTNLLQGGLYQVKRVSDAGSIYLDERSFYLPRRFGRATPAEIAKATEYKATEPDVDGWIEHDGKGCPVAVGSLVRTKRRAKGHGEVCFEATKASLSGSSDWFWSDTNTSLYDIVAYRLVKPVQLAWTIEVTA